MSATIAIPQRPPRQFLPQHFSVSDWASLQPFFDMLLARPLPSADALAQWLAHRSELESVIAEESGWRYIRMTCYTDRADYSQAYQDFVQNIQPQIAPLADALNRKVLACPFLNELEQREGFAILIRNLRKEVEIFREENVPLLTEVTIETQKYAQLSGAMTIAWQGQEITLQQAAVYLLSPNRAERQQVYEKISARRLQDRQLLDELFSRLMALRHQVARNAGFSNFRDYMFKAYGRFDYTPQDCFDFHESVAAEVVPLLHELGARRKNDMKLDTLRPWDKAADTLGRPALKAFDGGQDLLEKSTKCFEQIDPYLGNCLKVMHAMGHLDVDSRKGKAPGGYNYPLAEIGVPFIFMNATSTVRDMTTLMHEGGHAVHNFLTKDLALADFKSPPMEVAELASMAMELISMDHWEIFFNNDEDLRRARLDQLEDLLETLAWVATIDKFQHWLYEHPQHTPEERQVNWVRIFDEFADNQTDWSGLDEVKQFLWQKQLHLYEVPFYYIEYGMAQLGAIAVWRNVKADKERGLQGYFNALKMGNLKTIPEIYAAAGVKFNFSRPYIRELVNFVKTEMQKA